MNIIEFLKRAFLPWQSNPGWNKDAFITIGGILIWGTCAIGEAFGVAIMPMYVVNIGPLLFGIGIGRASKEVK